jgi:hypothetical protein
MWHLIRRQHCPLILFIRVNTTPFDIRHPDILLSATLPTNYSYNVTDVTGHTPVGSGCFEFSFDNGQFDDFNPTPQNSSDGYNLPVMPHLVNFVVYFAGVTMDYLLYFRTMLYMQDLPLKQLSKELTCSLNEEVMITPSNETMLVLLPPEDVHQIQVQPSDLSTPHVIQAD